MYMLLLRWKCSSFIAATAHDCLRKMIYLQYCKLAICVGGHSTTGFSCTLYDCSIQMRGGKDHDRLLFIVTWFTTCWLKIDGNAPFFPNLLQQLNFGVASTHCIHVWYCQPPSEGVTLREIRWAREVAPFLDSYCLWRWTQLNYCSCINDKYK